MHSTESPDESPSDEPPEPKGKPLQIQPNNPLHGVKLVDILEHLVERYGWEGLGARININCFKSDPSIKSSLKFLRKTQWAREKVEGLYLRSIRQRPR